MPVITVTAPEGLRPPLQDIASGVADALKLGPGDVIALELPYENIAWSGSEPGQGIWVLISLRGSDRGESASHAACEAARGAALKWGARVNIEIEGVWCEWVRS